MRAIVLRDGALLRPSLVLPSAGVWMLALVSTFGRIRVAVTPHLGVSALW
jgi:hypothetical protein